MACTEEEFCKASNQLNEAACDALKVPSWKEMAAFAVLELVKMGWIVEGVQKVNIPKDVDTWAHAAIKFHVDVAGKMVSNSKSPCAQPKIDKMKEHINKGYDVLFKGHQAREYLAKAKSLAHIT